MKLIEFTAYLHEEIQNLIFPKCNYLEKIGIGITLGMVDYKIGEILAQNADFVQTFGLIDSTTGDVNLDCAEHALNSGLTWPLKLGPFTFDEKDLKSVMQSIRERDPQYRNAQKQSKYGGN